MSKKTHVLLALLLIWTCAGILALGSYFVWIPDILTKSESIVGKFQSQDGQSLTVAQQWNGIDFYSTYLEHRNQNGDTVTFVLDGDDIKRWSCNFKESSGKVEIMFGHEKGGTFVLKNGVFINHNGNATFGLGERKSATK